MILLEVTDVIFTSLESKGGRLGGAVKRVKIVKLSKSVFSINRCVGNGHVHEVIN